MKNKLLLLICVCALACKKSDNNPAVASYSYNQALDSIGIVIGDYYTLGQTPQDTIVFMQDGSVNERYYDFNTPTTWKNISYKIRNSYTSYGVSPNVYTIELIAVSDTLTQLNFLEGSFYYYMQFGSSFQPYPKSDSEIAFISDGTIFKIYHLH